jgi:hypothetical protein
MIKLLIAVFALAIFSFGQSPTPMPEQTNDQKAKEMESASKRIAAERSFPVKPSMPLYAKNGNDSRILVYLTAYRPKPNEPDSAKMEVCFDISEFFSERSSNQDTLIENALILIDGHEVLFKTMNDAEPPLAESVPAGTYYRNWQFRLMLSKEEAILLNKANSVSIRWNKGNIDLDQKGLEVKKKFVSEEMPDLKENQVALQSLNEGFWHAVISFFEFT